MKKMLIVTYLKDYAGGCGYESDDAKYLWYPLAILDGKTADAVKNRLNDRYPQKEIFCFDAEPLNSWDSDSQQKFAVVIQKDYPAGFLSKRRKACIEEMEAIKTMTQATAKDDLPLDTEIILDGSTRYITISGMKSFYVKGLNQWNFIKDLVSAHKSGQSFRGNKDDSDGLRNALKNSMAIV
jgi:hypothetical protein